MQRMWKRLQMEITQWSVGYYFYNRKAIRVTARGEGTKWRFIKANFRSSFCIEKLSGKSFAAKQSEEVGEKNQLKKHSSCNSEASYICKLF